MCVLILKFIFVVVILFWFTKQMVWISAAYNYTTNWPKMWQIINNKCALSYLTSGRKQFGGAQMSGSALGTCMLEAEARRYHVTSSGTPKGPEDLHLKWHMLSLASGRGP